MFYRDVLWDNSKLEINVHTPIPEGYAENISGWGWPNEWPGWNWKGNEGKPLQVRVFTKASHVQLELNGKRVGEKDMKTHDKYIAVFEVPYQPGELAASGNANPKDMASVNRTQIGTYRGKALAIIRPSGSGNVKLVAESQGLKTGELIIQVTD